MSTPLGSKLKIARERLGLNRSEVARRADIDAAMLFRIENADNSAPTFAVVCRIARVLGACLDWLALDRAIHDEETIGEPIMLSFEARRALVVAAQHLELAIGKPLDQVDAPNVKRLGSSKRVQKSRAAQKNRLPKEQ